MFIAGLLDLHSFIRYAVIALLILSIIIAFHGLIKGKRYSERTRKLHFFTQILLNIQMLAGVTLYILKGYYHTWADLSEAPEMIVFFSIVHIAGMVTGISLVNIGYGRAVKAGSDRASYKNIATFYTIGFLVIFLMIPWPFFHDWAMWF